MEYYAFKNKRNCKLISGTNFRVSPNRQILASEWRKPLLIPITNFDMFITNEIRRRHINPKTYKVVKVEVKEVQK